MSAMLATFFFAPNRTVASIAVGWFVGVAIVEGQITNQPAAIAPEKLAVLERSAAQETGTDIPTTEPDAEIADSDAATEKFDSAARIITGASFECYGTGGFGLQFKLSSRPGSSHLGYIVDASNDNCQDMVILEDLSGKSSGTVTIQAGCSDLHKAFPYTGLRMATTPWTSDSEDHWAYWIRKVVTTGAARGSSFDSIQSAIWYITDRSGNYDGSSLLSAAGYPRNGPSKNASSGVRSSSSTTTDVPIVDPGDCGSGLCGSGQVALMPLTIFGIFAMKTRVRRLPNNS